MHTLIVHNAADCSSLIMDPLMFPHHTQYARLKIHNNYEFDFSTYLSMKTATGTTATCLAVVLHGEYLLWIDANFRVQWQLEMLNIDKT